MRTRINILVKVIMFLSMMFFLARNSDAQMNHIRFSAPELYAMEAAPGHISGTDFNHDGITDFVIASILEGGGNLMISNSEGKYDISRNHQDGEATISLTFDYDKDSWTDYAIVTNHGIRVVRNVQGVMWTKKTFFEYYLGFITIHTGPITICSSDFDHDGFSELAVAIVEPTNNAQFVKLIQNQNGVLAEDTTSYSLTDGRYFEHLRSMVSGDFNNDGWDDLAITFTDDKKLSILLNDGAGSFKTPQIDSLNIQAWMALCADFNQDGIDDLVIGSQADSSIVVLYSDGTGHFTQSDRLMLTDQMYSVNSADLDGDGDNDLFANSIDNIFTSWQNDGNGKFSIYQRTDIGAYDVGYGLMSFRSYINFVATDLNKDGAPELAGIFDGNQVGIVYNTGDGTFESPISYEFPLFAMDFLQIVDYDKNGYKDIVGFDGLGQIAAIFNEGNGNFNDFSILEIQPKEAISNYFSSLESILIKDLNSDNIDDISGIYWRVEGELGLFVLRGLGEAFIESCNTYLNHMDSVTARYPDASFYNVSPIGAADFDYDGLIDLAFTMGDSLYIMKNIGDCHFERQQAFDLPSSLTVFGDPIPLRIYKLFITDINHDQWKDLVLNAESEIVIYTGMGNGRFSFFTMRNHPVDPYFASEGKPIKSTMIDTADFNNDSYTDMVLPIGHYLGLSFLWGTGSDTLNESNSFYGNMENAAMPSENDLMTLDLDMDNRTDVAIVNGNPSFRGNNIILLRNENDNFTMTDSKVYAIGDRPTKGLTGDLNNDGFPDVVVQYDWKKVKILLNKSEEAPPTFISQKSSLPVEYHLFQNYPNPFNPTTTIEYQLPRSGEVSLKIYNLIGQTVRNLIDEKQLSGKYSTVWDGKNDNGQLVASGIYFCKIHTQDFLKTMKMILIR